VRARVRACARACVRARVRARACVKRYPASSWRGKCAKRDQLLNCRLLRSEARSIFLAS